MCAADAACTPQMQQVHLPPAAQMPTIYVMIVLFARVTHSEGVDLGGFLCVLPLRMSSPLPSWFRPGIVDPKSCCQECAGPAKCQAKPISQAPAALQRIDQLNCAHFGCMLIQLHEAGVDSFSNRPSRWPFPTVYAPNTCIGGSGAGATTVVENSARDFQVPSGFCLGRPHKISACNPEKQSPAFTSRQLQQPTVQMDVSTRVSHHHHWGLGGLNCALFCSMPLGFSPTSFVGLSCCTMAYTRPVHSAIFYGSTRLSCVIGMLMRTANPTSQTYTDKRKKITLYAPNTCIGGSGAGARVVIPARKDDASQQQTFPLCRQDAHADGTPADWLLWFLYFVIQPLMAAKRSCLVLFFASLMALLLRPIRHLFAMRARLKWWPGGSHERALNALAVASPAQPVLSWQPWRNRKGRLPKPPPRGTRRTTAAPCLLWWMLMAHLMPQPTEAVPMRWLPCAFFISAQAMARTEAPDDLPGVSYAVRRLHLIPPEELTSHVGECPLALATQLADRQDGSEERIRMLQPDPRQASLSSDDAEVDSQWLGVYLFTPHYKTLMLAIRPPERTLQSALDLIAMRSIDEDIPFDTVIPLRPQRFAHYGFFIRFHSSAKHAGFGGQAAIALDLTPVGGHFFSTFLPIDLSYQTLIEYITPLTTDGELAVYIGMNRTAWPLHERIHLADGDVITVLRERDVDFHKHTASELFGPEAEWGSIQSMPRLEYFSKVCVLHRHQRYMLAPHYHYDQSVVDYVAQRLRLDVHATVMCSYPIADLDVQGELATHIIAVAEVPSPYTTGMTREAARDLFVLIDPRPLGFKPAFLFIHHPVVHLPTIAALLGLAMPPAYQIGVKGGKQQGDDIFFEGCTTLVLVREPRPFPRSDDSDTSSPQPMQGREVQEDPFAYVPSPVDITSPYESPGDGVSRPLTAWEGDALPTFGDQPGFDTTLPAGHTWNIGVPEPESSPLETRPTVYPDEAAERLPSPQREPMEARVAGPTSIQALIYAPDFVPEIVTVSIPLPATAVHFLAMLAEQRLDIQAHSFSQIFPASPQPIHELAILVAAPDWQSDTATVLFDCRRHNECLFAKAVPLQLNRESLLLAAGIPTDDPVHVYVHGLLRPLGIDQRITLKSGMTVSILPRADGAPCAFDLASRLATPEGWDADAPIPGPRTHFESHFYVLTEAWPFTFPVRRGCRASFKEDLANSIGARPHNLTIKPSVPRIVDSFVFGYWASGVVVATEILGRVPFPPARRPENRYILILDQRRILRGFRWKLVEGTEVTVDSLLHEYNPLCPYRHSVVFTGLTPVDLPQGPTFIIRQGQVIVVEFQPWPSTADHASSADDGPPPPPTDGHSHDTPDVPGARPTGPAAPGTAPRQRSRSPRPKGDGPAPQNEAVAHSAATQQPCAPCKLVAAQLIWAPFLEVEVCTAHVSSNYWQPQICLSKLWCNFLRHPGTLHSSHLGPLDLDLHEKARHLTDFAESPIPTATCKLLTEPASGGPEARRLDALRDTTRQLGETWPFPPFRWPIEIPGEEITDDEVEEEDGSFLTDVCFYLLTPDYTPERLDLSVVLPQTVQEISDLVQVCRDAARKQLYPTLIEVVPQPDPGWGIMLAIPEWVRHRKVVCVDLSLYDGRIIAIASYTVIDTYHLCELVGLAAAAQVDVYVPGQLGPVPRGSAIVLATGMCVSIVNEGRSRPPVFSLTAMLRTHLPWEHSPVFPRDSQTSGYCVAGPNGQSFFRLRPERAMYYRSDIALLADLHPFRVVVYTS